MQVLSEKAIPPTRGVMGRPPLHNKATQVRLSPSVMERIEALVGKSQRAKFIREAVENELEHREAKTK